MQSPSKFNVVFLDKSFHLLPNKAKITSKNVYISADVARSIFDGINSEDCRIKFNVARTESLGIVLKLSAANGADKDAWSLSKGAVTCPAVIDEVFGDTLSSDKEFFVVAVPNQREILYCERDPLFSESSDNLNFKLLMKKNVVRHDVVVRRNRSGLFLQFSEDLCNRMNYVAETLLNVETVNDSSGFIAFKISRAAGPGSPNKLRDDRTLALGHFMRFNGLDRFFSLEKDSLPLSYDVNDDQSITCQAIKRGIYPYDDELRDKIKAERTGVYIIYDSENEIRYIGKGNPVDRIRENHARQEWFGERRVTHVGFIDLTEATDLDRFALERALLENYSEKMGGLPAGNRVGGNAGFDGAQTEDSPYYRMGRFGTVS